MTGTDSYTFLRSERAELQRLIDGCGPDDVSRLGFEGRLAQVEREIAGASEARARVADAEIMAAARERASGSAAVRPR